MNVDLTTALSMKRPLEASLTKETSFGQNQQRQRQQQAQFIQQTPLTAQQLANMRAVLTGELSQHFHQQLQESTKRRKLVDEEAQQHHPQQDHGEYEDTDDAGGDDDSDCDEDGQSPNGIRFREYQAEIWSEKFEELCAFRRVHQHCHVPHQYTDNPSLAQWVKRQRYQFKLKMEGKHSTLSDERIRLLTTIGFIWNSHDAVWEERLLDLVQFKRCHGHCIVPSNYEANVQLAVWTKRQRRQYKKAQEGSASSMTPERIAKLEQVGFVWDCRQNNKTATTTQVNNTPADESPWPSVSIPKNHQNERASAGTLWKSPSYNHAPNNTPPQDNFDQNGEVYQQEREEKLVTPMAELMASASTSEGARYHQIRMSAMTNNAVASSLHQPELSQQQLPRMPKCEFFSFSRSFKPSINKNTAV